MKHSLYGPCGLFCGACPAEDCDGCLSQNVDEYVLNCTFRTCTKEKGIDFCCFCEDYPCQELDKFMHDQWPHHWTIESSFTFIKENGVEEWLKSQKQGWSCLRCGAETKWYQKKCKCGQQLEAWDVPE